MWKTLGNLRETVKEGLQEFSRDALRETTLIRSSVVDNVVPVTKSLANAEIIGRRFRDSLGSSHDQESSSSKEKGTEEKRQVELQPAPVPLNDSPPSGHGSPLSVIVMEDEAQEGGEGWEGQLTPVIPVISEDGEGWEVDAPIISPSTPATTSIQPGSFSGTDSRLVGASSDPLKSAREIRLPLESPLDGRTDKTEPSHHMKASVEAELEGASSGSMRSISLKDDSMSSSVLPMEAMELSQAEMPLETSSTAVHTSEEASRSSSFGEETPGKAVDMVTGDTAAQLLTASIHHAGDGDVACGEAPLRPQGAALDQGRERSLSSEGLQDLRKDGTNVVRNADGFASDIATAGVTKGRILEQSLRVEAPKPADTAAIPPVTVAEKKEINEVRQRARKDKAELERLEALCTQLRSSLEEALAERTSLAEQLSQMEDNLEEARAEGTRLEAEVEELEAAATEAAKMAEEELQAAQNDYQKLQDRTHAAEAKAKQHEKEAAAAKKEREALEQRIKSMTASLEKRMTGLTSELQLRQTEIEELKEEGESMEKAFTELRALLEESVDERDSLVETLAERDKMLEELRLDLEKADAEVETARREAAESSVALAEAAAEARTLREAAKGKELGEDELQQLEVALKAATASAQAAAAEAAEWKEKSQQAAKEVKAKARALAQAEADLALAHQRVLAAEADADEAKRLKAEAEGTSEQLREQTERRAKVFNAAVKAAVSKIQSELEGERDEALERIQGLEADAVAHTAELQGAQEQVITLMEELDVANAAVAKGEEGRQELLAQVGSLEKEVVDAKERAQEAANQAETARASFKGLAKKVAALEAQCQELQDEVEAAKQETARQVAGMDAERELTKELLAGAEREKTSLKIAALEASAKAGEEASALRGRISELEGRMGASEHRALRITESARKQLLEASGTPSKGKASERKASALADLGLDKVRVERLIYRDKPPQADVEGARHGWEFRWPRHLELVRSRGYFQTSSTIPVAGAETSDPGNAAFQDLMSMQRGRKPRGATEEPELKLDMA